MKHLIIDEEKCVGCGICKSVCIRDNIEMNYREKLDKDINKYEEKIRKQAKIKRDKIKRNTEDYLKINGKIIE